MTSGEGEGLLKLASFRLMTLFVVVSLACLITWLNSRERTTFTEPSPNVRHAPPYEMKEMAIDVCLDRGWPVWHTRLSMGVMAHNANLYIEDFGTPEAKPRYGGTFGLTKEAGTREYSLLGRTKQRERKVKWRVLRVTLVASDGFSL